MFIWSVFLIYIFIAYLFYSYHGIHLSFNTFWLNLSGNLKGFIGYNAFFTLLIYGLSRVSTLEDRTPLFRIRPGHLLLINILFSYIYLEFLSNTSLLFSSIIFLMVVFLFGFAGIWLSNLILNIRVDWAIGFLVSIIFLNYAAIILCFCKIFITPVIIIFISLLCLIGIYYIVKYLDSLIHIITRNIVSLEWPETIILLGVFYYLVSFYLGGAFVLRNSDTDWLYARYMNDLIVNHGFAFNLFLAEFAICGIHQILASAGKLLGGDVISVWILGFIPALISSRIIYTEAKEISLNNNFASTIVLFFLATPPMYLYFHGDSTDNMVMPFALAAIFLFRRGLSHNNQKLLLLSSIMGAVCLSIKITFALGLISLIIAGFLVYSKQIIAIPSRIKIYMILIFGGLWLPKILIDYLWSGVLLFPFIRKTQGVIQIFICEAGYWQNAEFTFLKKLFSSIILPWICSFKARWISDTSNSYYGFILMIPYLFVYLYLVILLFRKKLSSKAINYYLICSALAITISIFSIRNIRYYSYVIPMLMFVSGYTLSVLYLPKRFCSKIMKGILSLIIVAFTITHANSVWGLFNHIEALISNNRKIILKTPVWLLSEKLLPEGVVFSNAGGGTGIGSVQKRVIMHYLLGRVGNYNTSNYDELQYVLVNIKARYAYLWLPEDNKSSIAYSSPQGVIMGIPVESFKNEFTLKNLLIKWQNIYIYDVQGGYEMTNKNALISNEKIHWNYAVKSLGSYVIQNGSWAGTILWDGLNMEKGDCLIDLWVESEKKNELAIRVHRFSKNDPARINPEGLFDKNISIPRGESYIPIRILLDNFNNYDTITIILWPSKTEESSSLIVKRTDSALFEPLEIALAKREALH